MRIGEDRTIMSFEGDDPESGAILAWQEVSLEGDSSPIDNYNQGTSTIAAIGPYYQSPTGVPPSRPPNPIPITGGTIPWWWLAGQTQAPPNCPTIVVPGSSGSGKQFYY